MMYKYFEKGIIILLVVMQLERKMNDNKQETSIEA